MDKRGEVRGFKPWERTPTDNFVPTEDDDYYYDNLAKMWPKFSARPGNDNLDLNTKIAALKVSPSVVSLVSFSGDLELSHGSGIIIESEGNTNFVLGSANFIRRSTEEDFAQNSLADDLKIVVHAYDENSYKGEIYAYDFHYNVVVIFFKSDSSSFTSAKLRMLDDTLSLHQHEAPGTFSVLRPHSPPKVKPGDPVIVVARYFSKPFECMAAPGCFSVDSSDPHYYGCRVLALSTCSITRCGDGGPVVNLAGEVIGISYYDIGPFTPFLPINIAWKLWDHYKRHKELRHPSLGFEATNFCVADLSIMERIIKRFPTISSGVIVEKVVPGSSVHAAGLRKEDVIIGCGGKTVESFFQLWEVMWGHVGQAVELKVARPSVSNLVSCSMFVVEATLTGLNNWPHQV